MSEAHILVVDDEHDIRELVKEILEDEGFQVSTAANGETARAQYSSQDPNLVLLDIWMPDVDGISLLQEWQNQAANGCPVVMMSGHGTVETAVEATRSGAFDFIEKPLSVGKLLLTVRKALEESATEQPLAARTRVRSVQEPLGNSASIQAFKQSVEKAAAHDVMVLITGEPGSGKEAAARYLHARSRLGDEPFISLDPAAVGGGDGQISLNRLLAETATGTLYLTDLATLGSDTQERLNAVLESGKYVAEHNARLTPFSGRIIAASSLPADDLVNSGKLSEALYFRLNVLQLKVPPLRDRSEDVPDLVKYYTEYLPSHENLPYRHFSVAAQNRLRNYSWPGNILELKNLIRQLLIMGQADEISSQEVEQAIRQSKPRTAPAGSRQAAVFELPLREAREEFEREYLIYQLGKVGGSVGRLSEAVGMERTHLYRKLRALGIDPKSIGRNRRNS